MFVEKRLVLHLGLPKTGSTSLQTFVFPQYDNYLGQMGRKKPSKCPASELAKIYQRPASRRLSSMERWLEHSFQARRSVIISDESLSNWARHSGALESPVAHRSRPHPVIDFLAEIKGIMGENGTLQVIVTFRNQPDLLASLYSQLWRKSRDLSQGDFDFRVGRIINSGDNALCHGTFYSELRATLGEANVLVNIFERGLDENASAIRAFLGSPIRGSGGAELPIENRRNSGPGKWTAGAGPRSWGDLALSRKIASRLGPENFRTREFLRAAMVWMDRHGPNPLGAVSAATINVSERLRHEILWCYREDNRRLENLVGAQLSGFGY